MDDDKSALIVDFNELTVTAKSLLDLEEAALVTKAVEPFFLDSVNGTLYSWEGPIKSNKASLNEESKLSE